MATSNRPARLGHREAAARPLGGRLAEVAPQLGGVGHREAGAVDEPDAMAAPAGAVGGRDRSAAAVRLQQVLPDGQGEPLAGLAVGAGGEGPAAEVDDVLAGGVAVEDLEEEQVDGGDGVEDAVAPAVADGAAGVADGVGAEAGGEVLPQPFGDGLEAMGHGGAPSAEGCPGSTPW